MSATVQLSQPCRQFQFQEIQSATHYFDESLVIGRGGSGEVYKGTIYNGSTPIDAAVKRLDSSSQGASEFWAEVEMLSKLRHSHLVSLFGYCNHGKAMILIYEFMPNGSLEDHLHKLGTPLSWLQRLEICIGAARGLDYLHTGTGIESGVIHRDVKSSNILLNEIWAAKIADFGLSRVTPRNQTFSGVNTLVKGTFGYIDPDYYNTGRLTRKSDVYAFGVVLLEVLCRKRAVDRSLDEDQWNLAIWAQESIKAGNLKSIIDYDIRREISPKCLKLFVRIAERCLLGNPKQRPSMAEVVVSLKSLQTLQLKVNSSLRPAVATIFGRMVHKLPFSSNGEGKTSAQGAKHNSTSAGEVPTDYRIKKFEFADLKRATSKFSKDLIFVRGAFSTVFLGWVDKDTFAPSMRGAGMAVAVKRFDQHKVLGHEKYMREVEILGRLAHPNIVSLLGYCHHEDEHLLVYEYMRNGSFAPFLWRKLPHHIARPLSWGTRLAILIGVARGLSYLHSSDVIHSDVKSMNILLDQDFNSKLGYFDPEIALGTIGNYAMTGDIYDFGIVLLETLSGLQERDLQQLLEQRSVVGWASLIRADRRVLMEVMMDPCLEQHYPKKGAFKCIELAVRCLQDEPKDRPSSDEVLQSLEQIYAIDN